MHQDFWQCRVMRGLRKYDGHAAHFFDELMVAGDLGYLKAEIQGLRVVRDRITQDHTGHADILADQLGLPNF